MVDQTQLPDTFAEYIAGVPHEFLGDVREWKATIQLEYERAVKRINRWHDVCFNLAKAEIPVGNVGFRKAFARHVMHRAKDYSSFIFALRDEKLTPEMIYRK